MGTVCLAEDLNFTPSRKTVLKFIKTELLADPDMRARFKREADALASVNHPGVVTVFEVGEWEREPFIAMEYVEGKTLRSVLQENQLSLERSLELALEMGEALYEAHQKGVMHRDVKPDNVLIKANGRTKLIDFGLAKTKNSTKLTRTGTAAGTFGYMSPEQIWGVERSGELDFRTDIFSFGIVLYEMISSRHPFDEGHEAAVIYSIENDPPPPLCRLNSQVTPELQAAVEKALAKKREERFQNMEELLTELRKFTRTAQKRESPSSDSKKSVAVLYFENRSADPESDYFSDGVTEDLVNDLFKIAGLRVAAINAVRPFRGKEVDIRIICQKLNVNYVVQGVIQRQGNRVRIRAALVDENNFNQWSERFDRELENIFDLQKEIAEKIARALQIELLDRDRAEISRRYKENFYAYDSYLKGRKYYYKFTPQDLFTAIEMFSDALEIDPKYALAYAGLADCYMALVDQGFETDLAAVKEWLKKGERAAQRALEIDPHCSEAHKALGTVYYKLWHFKKSKEHLLRALELNPKNAAARANLASTCVYLGEFEKAEKEYRQACEQDSELAFIVWLLARFYLAINRYAEAEKQIVPVLDSEESARYHQVARYIVSRICFFQGRFEKALDHMKRYSKVDPDDPAGLSALASLYAALGRPAEARKLLKKVLKKSPWDEDIIENLILAHAFLGEEESVHDWIKKAMDENKILWVFLEYNPHLEKLRPKEQFQRLLQEVKEKTFRGD